MDDFNDKDIYSNSEHSGEDSTNEGGGRRFYNIERARASRNDRKLRLFLISVLVILCILVFSLVIYMVNTIIFSNSGMRDKFSGFMPKGDLSTSLTTGHAGGPTLNVEEIPEDPKAMSAEQVYEKNSPSVVGVVVYDSDAILTSDQVGQGSGVVISEDGYVMTNSHVIGDSKNYKVKIVLNDGKEYPASVIGYDSRTDLAVIKANATGLVPATFGNSDSVKVGSWVIAIGNPGGINFANSLTRGVVSATNRTVGGLGQSQLKYIQTDAAINPGNSGGALINMYGQVIGINTAKITQVEFEGMGFAIPINTAKPVIDDIISKGYVSGRVRLGITGKPISPYQAQIHDVPQGIVVTDISPDSDMERKGIKIGDIIMKVNGANVTSFNVLYTELSKFNPGDKVNLTIFRVKNNGNDNETFDASITLLEDKGETQVKNESMNRERKYR